MSTNAQRQQALLVFGMHRSGTSATARVLNLLGAELSSELVETSFDNPKGFWEGAEVVAIHERFFAALSRTCYDMQKLPEGWVSHPVARQAVGEIVELVKRDFTGAALWTVKDPRMCLLAPLWLEALTSLDIEVKSLFVVRNPLEVTKSLHARSQQARNEWVLGYGPVMWGQYLVEAEIATRDSCRAMMTYDELLTDWRAVMSRVSREINIAWPNHIDDVGPSIDAFLDKSDQHHKAELSNADLHEMPDIVIRMYEECLLIVQQGRSWKGLQPLAQEFLIASNVYSGALSNVIRHYRDCQTLVQETTAQVIHGEGIRQQMELTIEAYRIQAEKYDDLLRAANAKVELLGLQNAALVESTTAKIAVLDNELSAYRKQAEVYEERLRSANAMNVSLSANYSGLIDSVSAQTADFERQLQAYKEQAVIYDQQLREANGRVFHLTEQLQKFHGHPSVLKTDK